MNREKRLWIRVTEEEYNSLKQKATPAKNLSDYMRRVLFDNTINAQDPVRVLGLLEEHITELKHIGNNINQLAKHANQKGTIDSDALYSEFLKTFKEYNKKQGEMISVYKKIIGR